MGKEKGAREPTIENRRARHDYSIGDTIECGLELLGTEIKSIRDGHVSLGEGWVLAQEVPPTAELHGVHIEVYAPAGAARQHEPTRVRRLLVHRREIVRLATEVKAKGVTLVPLKIYFVRGRAKLLVGIATGRRKEDKRQAIKERETKREIDRAMNKRR
ncbi:MAG: SsrA-binding protein SmpB [Phycisphaerales bacterium]|nr:SsrA-binding protein SmpB [Phycisphaerales bacterium]